MMGHSLGTDVVAASQGSAAVCDSLRALPCVAGLYSVGVEVPEDGQQAANGTRGGAFG